MSTKIDHSLVMDEYYKHDLAYQDLYINSVKNRSELDRDLKIVYDSDEQQLQLNFGKSTSDRSGKILLYRPSDQQADQLIPFELKNSDDLLVLPTMDLLSGNWMVKVRWTDGSLAYYMEERIIIL